MTDNQEPKYQAIKLDTTTRWGIGLMGGAGVVTGGIATFTRDNEAGPTAMLALGALLFLIGMAGYLPTRLKIGDNEAEWKEPVADFVGKALEDAPPEKKAELETEARELAEALPARDRRVIESVLLENTVRNALGRIAAASGGALELMEPGPGHKFDNYIATSNGKSIAVEVLPVGMSSPNERRRAQDSIKRAAQQGVDLVLVRSGERTMSRRTRDGGHPFVVTYVDSRSDAILADAIFSTAGLPRP